MQQKQPQKKKGWGRAALQASRTPEKLQLSEQASQGTP